jgi:hypothetical protein
MGRADVAGTIPDQLALQRAFFRQSPQRRGAGYMLDETASERETLVMHRLAQADDYRLILFGMYTRSATRPSN